MKVRFLVNPSADKGKTAKRWKRMFEGRGEGLDVCVCEEPGDLERAAKNAIDEGVERLVIVGGDGSLNIAVNAIGDRKVELGVLPTGSGNDFARTACVDLVPPERYLEPCKARRIDIGTVGERRFINIFGSGFDADVAKGMQKSSLKGDLGYLTSVLGTLRIFRSPTVIVQTDREDLRLATMSVSVGNGKYHGGMFMLTPDADLADGELDLCLVRKIPKLRFLTLIPTSFKGRHVEIKDAVSMHRFHRMRLTFSHPVYYHVDGEVSDQTHSELQIKILPKALSFVIP
jgi:diacylglycerol kinase (ATP)